MGHAAQILDLFHKFLVLSPGSAELEPEKFENIEAGFKWAPRPELLVTGAIFQLDRTNGQTADPTDPTLVVLTGKTRTKGVELQLAGEIRSRLGSVEPDTVLEQVPDHHLTVWTRYDFSEQFGIGGGIVHSSSPYASLSNAVELPSYTRVDLAGYFTVNERLAL